MDDSSNIANRLSRAGPQHLAKATPIAGPGFYAWWIAPVHLRDANPPIPAVPFGDNSWSLLYVGIAPNGPRSSRSVDTRVTKDHQGGSIGNSTFRQSMAALLMEHLHLGPLAGYDRSRIEDETPLMSYIEQTCGLTTAGFPKPWTIETEVIKLLNPPLNLRPGFHEYRCDVKRARDRLWAACGLRPRAKRC